MTAYTCTRLGKWGGLCLAVRAAILRWASGEEVRSFAKIEKLPMVVHRFRYVITGDTHKGQGKYAPYLE